MISDTQLYSLAVFLGGLAMLLIVLYHFLEVNSKDADGLREKELVRRGGAGIPGAGTGGKGGSGIGSGKKSAVEKGMR